MNTRDIRDGETFSMKGSGAKPYELKNTGGVYSCTCPAWRNQSQPIERRTCKHLRKLRGDEAEIERVGEAATITPQKKENGVKAPPLLLANNWDNAQAVEGWWLSEKLDGVRAYWDGHRLLSRLGNEFHAPDWFTRSLPAVPLDGELWIGRKQFQQTVSVVRRQDRGKQWRAIRFLVFDAPQSQSRSQKARMRQRFRRRAAIEPVIGHLKQDHRLTRCFLKGHLGDAMNLKLAAAAWNLKKWMREVLFWLCSNLEAAVGWLLSLAWRFKICGSQWARAF